MTKTNRKYAFPVIALIIVLVLSMLVSCTGDNGEAARLNEEERLRQEALNAATEAADRYFVALNQTLIDRGYNGIKDGELYSVDGFFFRLSDNKAANITEEEYKAQLEQNPVIKNIIFLIPDGAGFGTYDYANAYKTKYAATAVNGIVDGIKDTETAAQATTITTNAIEGMTVNTLYLDQFMIAHADTSMQVMAGHSATDSAAAGTALLCGYKTLYTMTGISLYDYRPMANILEASRLDGKSTGFVTTKCLVDATPAAGTVHVLRRPDQDGCAYQPDASRQLLNSLIDVELCYGSDGGYVKAAAKYSDKLIIHDDRAANHGYTVVTDVTSLRNAVSSGAKKLFSKFQINYQELIDAGKDLKKTNYNMGTYSWDTDYQGHHLLYDVDATAGEDLTLMDLAKAAIEVLDKNINNPNGFCLVIEGGAIDNAAEQRYVKEAVGDYIAFDEVFGYCVNYAMQRGDTIVVACPDHDSGGFYDPATMSSAPNKGSKSVKGLTLDEILEQLHDGKIADTTVVGGEVIGHSPQDVPVWLYAPEPVRARIIEKLRLPADTSAEMVRTGRFYDGTVLNDACKIKNSDLAKAVVEAARGTQLGIATWKLFTPVYDNNDKEKYQFGTYDEETGVFTFENGAKVTRNCRTYTDAEGTGHEIKCGLPIYVTNPASYNYEDGSGKTGKKGTVTAVFYVPYEVLEVCGYAGTDE